MRIEQMPGGTYVKKLSPFEEDLIDRLYKEVREREAGQEFLELRLEEAEVALASAHDQIDTMKVEMEQIRIHIGMSATP